MESQHMKKHKPIHNLGHFAHPPKSSTNFAKPPKAQTESNSPKMIGKSVPPANVSKPKMRKG
jgi:hypothetical protein